MRTVQVAVAFVLALLPGLARATSQSPDQLIFQGEIFSIATNPLEAYFDATHLRPNDVLASRCPGCVRGYVAYWEIRDGALYLVKLVDGRTCTQQGEIALSQVFPGRTGPIEAAWFTGKLVILRGKTLRYVHERTESSYERMIVVQIVDGRAVQETTIENGRGGRVDGATTR